MDKRYFESLLNSVTVGELISQFEFIESYEGYIESYEGHEYYVESGKIYFQ